MSIDKPNIAPRDGCAGGALRPKLVVALILALGAWAYWPTLENLVEYWRSDPDFSHGFLVPPIAAVLLWTRRRLRPPAELTLHKRAVLFLAFAALIRYASARFYLVELDAWSIPLWLGGAVWMFFGWNSLRWAAPSLAFLWFAEPLPGSIEVLLSLPLQKLSAACSASLLGAVGLPAIAEGTTVMLPEHILDVERACSGMRILYAVLAVTCATLIWLRPPKVVGVCVLLATIPTALVANVARITIIGLLVNYMPGDGPHLLSHDLVGFAMVPFAAALIALAYGRLSALAGSRETARRGPRIQRGRLGWKLAAAGFAAAAIAWGRWQHEQALASLRDAAARCQERGDYRKSIEYLNRYVVARPDDDDALVRLAQLYDKVAVGRNDRLRAIQLARSAWRACPDQSELALKAIDGAIAVGDCRLALEICDEVDASGVSRSVASLIVQRRADALLVGMQSGESEAPWPWIEVDAAIAAALAVDNFDIRHVEARAEIIRERCLDKPPAVRAAEADELMDAAIQRRLSDPRVWLARSRYRRRYARLADDPAEALEAADSDLAKAVRLAHHWPAGGDAAEAFLAAAERSVEQGRRTRALGELRDAIQSAPADPRAYLLTAEITRQRGARADILAALDILEEARKSVGAHHPSVLLALASLRTQLGEAAAAEQLLTPLDAVLPRLPPRQQTALALGRAMVECQIASRRHGPSAAIAPLRRILETPDIRALKGPESASVAQAWRLLGQVYLSVGQADEACEAFAESGVANPADDSWQAALAESALRSGDNSLAEGHYQQLARRSPQSPDPWIKLAALELGRQRRRSRSQQDWRIFDGQLQRAHAAGATHVATELLVADRYVAEGDLNGAGRLLDELAVAAPDEPQVWSYQIALKNRAGDYDGAAAALGQLECLLPDAPEAVCLRAGLLAAQHRDDEAKALLSDRLATARVEQASQLAQALAGLQLQQGESAAAFAALETAHERAPDDVSVLDALASLALSMHEWNALEKYESWLRVAEGDDGTHWRAFRAQRLLASAAATTDPSYHEVVGIAESLLHQRPRWAKSHYLLGEIALRSNQLEAALAAYERAWTCGGGDIVLADRLIDVLTQLGRFDQASAYVTQVHGYLAMSPQLFDRAAPYFSGHEQCLEALRMAEQWVERQPEDAMANLRLARTLLVLEAADAGEAKANAARRSRAEAAIRRALDLAPRDVRVWNAAMAYCLQTGGGRKQALEWLRRFSDQTKLDDLEECTALAQLHAALSLPTDAHRLFQIALRLARAEPRDRAAASRALAAAASFYLARTPALAEEYSRAALEADASQQSARRTLIEALTRSPRKGAIDEAIKLAGRASPGDVPANADQLRLRCDLLLRRGDGRDLADAAAAMNDQLHKSANDIVILARLYEHSGEVGRAMDLRSQLALAPGSRPQDLVEFLRLWQTHFLAADDRARRDDQLSSLAQRVYDKLAGSPELLTTRLQWKLREHKVRTGAGDLPAGRVDGELKAILAAAEIASMTTAEHRELFHRLLAALLAEGAPVAGFHLAADPPPWISPAASRVALCRVLIAAQPDGLLQGSARSAILDGVRQFPDDPTVVQAAGEYFFMTGDYQQAVKFFRRVVQLEPGSLPGLNNLALSRAELPNGQNEVATLIAAAERTYPDDPQILDTKAVVALLDGRVDESLAILDEIRRREPADPVFELHASMAHQRRGDSAKSAEHLLLAITLGVDDATLSVRDRAFLAAQRSLAESTSYASGADAAGLTVALR